MQSMLLLIAYYAKCILPERYPKKLVYSPNTVYSSQFNFFKHVLQKSSAVVLLKGACHEIFEFRFFHEAVNL
jgi:hypothetical protein